MTTRTEYLEKRVVNKHVERTITPIVRTKLHSNPKLILKYYIIRSGYSYVRNIRGQTTSDLANAKRFYSFGEAIIMKSMKQQSRRSYSSSWWIDACVENRGQILRYPVDDEGNICFTLSLEDGDECQWTAAIDEETAGIYTEINCDNLIHFLSIDEEGNIYFEDEEGKWFPSSIEEDGLYWGKEEEEDD